MCGGAKKAKPERSTQRTDPAKRNRYAMILVGDNDTSSRPANDLGGVPGMRDGFGQHRHPGAMMR